MSAGDFTRTSEEWKAHMNWVAKNTPESPSPTWPPYPNPLRGEPDEHDEWRRLNLGTDR